MCQNASKNIENKTGFLASNITELHTSYMIGLTKGSGFCATIQNK